MNINKLVGLFYHKLNGPDDATAEDAMRVVVRAVRDEMHAHPGECWACEDNRNKFDQILGAAGDEAAGSTPEGVVVPCSAEGEPPASPAAAPAPAVCEWTPQDEGPAHEIWKTGCGTMYERAKSTGWCNKCKAPIKFTEET